MLPLLFQKCTLTLKVPKYASLVLEELILYLYTHFKDRTFGPLVNLDNVLAHSSWICISCICLHLSHIILALYCIRITSVSSLVVLASILFFISVLIPYVHRS